jgi:chemotaxis protein MotB
MADGTIIVKRIKKGGHGHHGGAWKVAFADFVTAMMAFFMLMWLMGSTTPEQRAAISEYMKDPIASSGPGGSGANQHTEGGQGILDGQGPKPFDQSTSSERPESQPNPGTAPSETITPEQAEELAKEKERQQMQELLDELKKAIEATPALKDYKDQLLLDITSEGLRIQIIDKENRAMFAQGSPVMENYARTILRDIAKVINQVPNHISVSGHTDQTPYASTNGYSNWELSADRANAARRELLGGGMPEQKIGRVVGLSSSVLFDKDHPFSPQNRRISIIVMNKATEASITQGERNQAVKVGEAAGASAAPPAAAQPATPQVPAAPPASTPPAPAPATPPEPAKQTLEN